MKTLNEQALLHRAKSMLASGNPHEAKLICEQLISRDKNNADAYFFLAESLNHLTQYDDCLTALKRCVALRPKSIVYLLTLGTRHLGQGEHAPAVAAYKKALRVDPNCLDAIAGLAHAHELEGSFDEARAILQPHIDAGRINAWMVQVYATLEMRANRAQSAAAILSRHAAASAPELFFDLGKAYEKLKQFDLAFEAYRQGNEILKRDYDLAGYIDIVKRTIKTFSPQTMKRLSRARHNSRLPVLVTARPRSGTTLVERIICAHPQAHAAGELPYIAHLSQRLNLEIGSTRVYPECAMDMDQNDVDRLGQEYIAHLRNLGGSATRVVDKNMASMYNLGLVSLIAPQTAAVLCVRDPIDNCLSCYCEDIRNRHHYATDLRLLGITYEIHGLLRQYWLKTLDMTTLEVHYEDVVADQEGMSRKIIDFCGLPWDDKCLKFYEVKSESKSSSAAPTLSYDQVRKPIYKTSVGRAQHFAKHLGPLYEGFEEGKRICDEIRAELKLPS